MFAWPIVTYLTLGGSYVLLDQYLSTAAWIGTESASVSMVLSGDWNSDEGRALLTSAVTALDTVNLKIRMPISLNCLGFS